MPRRDSDFLFGRLPKAAPAGAGRFTSSARVVRRKSPKSQQASGNTSTPQVEKWQFRSQSSRLRGQPGLCAEGLVSPCSCGDYEHSENELRRKACGLDQGLTESETMRLRMKRNLRLRCQKRQKLAETGSGLGFLTYMVRTTRNRKEMQLRTCRQTVV